MFAIYVPAQIPATEFSLSEIGCGPLFDPSCIPMFVDSLAPGPDGGHGRLCYFDSPEMQDRPLAMVDLKQQQWIDASQSGDLKRGRYWLGWWKDSRPTSMSLLRRRVVDGLPVRLLDGNDWVIPIVDFFPQRLTVDRDSGKESTANLQSDMPFVKQANDLFSLFISDEFQKTVMQEHVVSIPNGLRFAAEALSVNYRVNFDLVDAMELIGEYEAFEIARVVTGLAAVQDAAQKKTESVACAI